MTSKQVRILKLNKLSNDTKEKIYNKLISGEYIATIDIFTEHKKYYDVNVSFAGDGHHESDLCINHFGYNFFARTPQAVKGKRYKTFGRCIGELNKLINSYFGNVQSISNLRIYNGKSSWYGGKNIFNMEV